MHLPTIILPALLALTSAAPADLDTRQRQERDVEMLYLFGIPGISSSGNTANFIGRGTVGQCQNFPSFVKGFKQANPIDGFTCTLYFESNCKGSALTIGPVNPFRASGERGGGAKDPVIESWKCSRIAKNP
ncbi:hypothetical protein B0T16DRAFT_392190 [Cercophora newfieldiana]|uniref:Uncharacterized protein n=1 Tax=Cercophora newfieldiana TaxID=92897 RepID=A0AA39Y0G1_9PEZI|nr:hypothetical protein B0T16DRAFT_392190 [Cercophora newfieldiana]